MKVSINYTGGAHGHFLEYACNHIFCNAGRNPKQRVSDNGTYHVPLTTTEQLLYLSKKKFTAFPFWWLHPHPVTQTWPKVPHKLENTIINISSKSIEEIALLRIYWRRRGDGFFLSPTELLNASRQEFIEKRDNNKPHVTWNEGESLAKWQRNLLSENALSLYKNDTLDEMTVIRFWMDPYLSGERVDQEWMVDTSVQFIESIDKRVIEFPMKWFYCPNDFLSGITMIGTELGMEKKVPDSEILEIVQNITHTIHEYPKNMPLVFEKFEAIKRKELVDLSILELNDKIMLVTLLNIEYKLWYGDYEHLTEFPKTSDKLVEIINNRVIAV